MKYQYEFLGETVEIDVTEQWVTVLEDMDRQEYNNDHKETRRHYHLEGCDYEGEDFAVDDPAFLELYPTEAQEQVEAAMACLTDTQRDVIKALFFHGMTVKEYAAQRGVALPTVSKAKSSALKKMKKFLHGG